MRKYFDIFPVDFNQLAYVCGFIVSDGCLKRGGDTISFGNHINDSCVLEGISKMLKSPPVPVRVYNDNVAHLNLNHKPLYDFCVSIGMTPNKSLTLDVNIDHFDWDWKLHFIRGVIDGDGWVGWGNRKIKSSCAITIASASESFVKYIQSLLGIGSIDARDTTGISFGTNIAYRLTFKASFAYDLAKVLPKESYMLGRKTDKLDEIISSGRPNKLHNWGNLKQFCLNNRLNYKLVHSRLNRGWSWDDAITIPASHSRHYTKNGKIKNDYKQETTASSIQS